MKLQSESPGWSANSSSRADSRTNGLSTAGITTAQASPIGKALLALAKFPVRLELPAGAVLFLVVSLVLFGISLRRA